MFDRPVVVLNERVRFADFGSRGEGRLLIVGTFLSSSRSIRSVCEDLAARLSGHGWKLLTTSAKAGRVSRLLDMVYTAWRHRRVYHMAHVDVYSGAAFLWAEIVCFVLRRAGKPYILTLHGGDLPRFSGRWPGRVRNLLRSAVAVTVPSGYLLEQMRPYRENLRLIPNAINVSAYPFRLREKPAPRLVWLRAFHEIYNPSLAPRVLALLREQFSEIQLSMAGSDKNDGSWRKTHRIADDLGVSDRIRWAGGVPKAQVPSILNEGDIFLNTTDFDNTPVTVMEAMACGLCVVSTDAGGLPFLLESETNALLVPCGDPAAMARAVARILSEPGLARRLSSNARQLAEQLDWSRILPQWEGLFLVAGEGDSA